MTARPVKNPQELPGRTVYDQLGRKLGPVQQLYAPGGEGDPMWATVETSTGLFHKRVVFLPLARLKEEGGNVQTPYSRQYIEKSPDVEPGDELAPEDDRALRDHYGIDRGDEELRANELVRRSGPGRRRSGAAGR